MATMPQVTVNIEVRNSMREFVAAMARVTATITRLRLALRDPRYRRLGAEHWTLHHAPKPHPPVKANRRVHRRRK